MASRRIMTVAAVVAVTALAGALGCNNTQTVERTSGGVREIQPAMTLIAQSRARISDVPVPLGYKLDEGKSRDFQAAGARYVDHVYHGNDDKFAVGRFYRRQMPINRWTLVTDIFVQGVIQLDFAKDTEVCRIAVDDRHNLFHPSVIKVQLWTSGRIEPAPEPQGDGEAAPEK